jgi:hypothetical protein
MAITSRLAQKKILMFVFFLGYAFSIYASPQVLIYQSPILWRLDNEGDYFLDDLAEGIHESKDIVYTDGTITSVVANWKFEGEVKLEISANGGKDYTSITNGLPLFSGFVLGRDLRWKADIGPGSKLLEVKLSYTDTLGVKGSFGQPALSGFKYRKIIDIGKGPQKDLFNYQISLKIGESQGSVGADLHCEGNIEADFRDIRFTAADKEMLLPYYIEEINGVKPNRTVNVWVKVPQIPPEGVNIYVYYGRKGAANLSNADSVFDFYDNFSKNYLNEEKWNSILEPRGMMALSSSGLALEDAAIHSKDFQFREGIIEYSAQVKLGAESSLIIRGKEDASLEDMSQVAYSSAYEEAQHCIAIGSIVKANDPKPILTNQVYDYRVFARGNKITFIRYSRGFKEKQAQVSYQDVEELNQGYLGLRTKGEGISTNLTVYKWIRVRKSATPAPQVIDYFYTVQETANVPLFNNAIVTSEGDIGLVSRAFRGSYLSSYIDIPFEIRVMTSFYDAIGKRTNGVRLDISADGGKTFKTGCVNGEYYYASRGDFSGGDRLMYRLTLNKKNDVAFEALTLEYMPGNISVIWPNGAETLTGGSSSQIRWSAMEYELTYPMKLEYSLDNGQTYNLIADKVGNSGSFSWIVPDDAVSKKAYIKISDSLEDSVFDISDNSFTITEYGRRNTDDEI